MLTSVAALRLLSNPSFTLGQFALGQLARGRLPYIWSILSAMSVAGLGISYSNALSTKGKLEIDLGHPSVSAELGRDPSPRTVIPSDGQYYFNAAGALTMLTGARVMLTAMQWRRLLLGNLVMAGGSLLYQAGYIRAEVKDKKLTLSL